MTPLLRCYAGDDYSVEYVTDEVTIRLDPYALRACVADTEVIARLARGLCWGELMRVAAERLAGESDDYEGWGDREHGDQRTRIKFLEAVKHAADGQLLAEVEVHKRRIADLEVRNRRLFEALGGGSSNHEAHARACAIDRGEP